jgi:hypothetical protein
MDPVANPFRPGAGRRPPMLAGREALLEAFDVVKSCPQHEVVPDLARLERAATLTDCGLGLALTG